MSVWGKLSARIAAGVAVMVLAGCARPGMRLLTMEVYQSDQLVLRTTFDAPDREGPADFWRRTGAEPFASDDDDRLRAKLVGAVQIRIQHVDRLMTSASLTNLDLVRNTPDSLRWYLPKKEVQRARQASK